MHNFMQINLLSFLSFFLDIFFPLYLYQYLLNNAYFSYTETCLIHDDPLLTIAQCLQKYIDEQLQLGKRGEIVTGYQRSIIVFIPF